VSITPRRATVSTILLAVGLGVGLGGCGVADDQIRPGVAVSVDGTDIDVSEVDDTVSGACAFYDDNPETGALVPRVVLRRLVVETFTRREAAEALVEELGLDIDGDVSRATAGVEQAFGDAPPDQVAAMTAGEVAASYTTAASDAIGDALLREETGSEPGNPELIRARGVQAITDWLADHEIAINPTYGLQVDDGVFSADDGLSVPASTQAVFAQEISGLDLLSQDQAALGEAIEEATATLPDDQICGTRTAG